MHLLSAGTLRSICSTYLRCTGRLHGSVHGYWDEAVYSSSESFEKHRVVVGFFRKPSCNFKILVLQACFRTKALQYDVDLGLVAVERKSLNRFGGSFAKWRWQTLLACIKAALELKFLRTPARLSRLAQVCHRSEDQAEWTAVRAAMLSDRYWLLLECLEKLVAEVCSGCPPR